MAANLQVIEGIASIVSDGPLDPRARLKRSRVILAPHGLDASEVGERRQRYGTNDMIETVGSPVAELVRDTARDPTIWFLIGTTILYFALGQSAEAATLLVSIVPLVGIDVYLHRRTQQSTSALRGMLASTARVVRDGAEVTVLMNVNFIDPACCLTNRCYHAASSRSYPSVPISSVCHL